MVVVWAVNGATWTTDGTVTLNDGRSFSLSDIPGKGLNANRLAKITTFAQRLIDTRFPIADLPVEDPDRIHAEAGDDAWFTETYGGRMFIDGSDVVSRSTAITLFIDESGSPNISFSEVN